MLTNHIDRVRSNTDESINACIDRRALERVASFSSLGPDAVDARLHELDREWDIERILEAAAAGVSIVTLTLGIAGRNRKWFAIPTAVAAFLLLHVVEGWCPPLPLLRRLGFRTQREIDDERIALKALRGDFAEIDSGAEFSDARRAWEAARA
jgi:hypothetical protein